MDYNLYGNVPNTDLDTVNGLYDKYLVSLVLVPFDHLL